MLQIENASIAYNEHVLFSDFNLHLHKGEIASIAGPSGCGKTSLLNAVLGFIPLKQGRIIICNTELTRTTVDQIRKQIAWIPQELALPMEWVREMIRLPFELKANRQLPFSENRLFHCFDALGLECELYTKRVNEISGGQRQRIMIAVASMLGKKLFVVDEPTSALDTDSGQQVLAFLRKQANEGCSILAVSHDKNFSQGCDKQILLNDYANTPTLQQ